MQHVPFGHPADDAAVGAHLEPFRIAHEHIDAAVAIDDIEHRIAAPRTSMQLEVGRDDEDLQIFPCGAQSRGREEQDK